MTEEKNVESRTGPHISENERLRFIGFEVFRTPPKRDFFKSESEKNQYVEKIHKKLESGEVLREDCTLCEERVSAIERFILLLASLLILGSLALPWFSAYNEVVEEVSAAPSDQAATQQAALPAGDTTALAAAAGSASTEPGNSAEATSAGTEPAATGTQPAPAQPSSAAGQQVTGKGLTGSEEIITSQVARKKIHREYEHLSGFAAIIDVGRFAGDIFSSGAGFIFASLVMFVYLLLCIVLPLFTIFKVFTLKGDKDQVALKLKKILKLSWIPVLLVVAALVLSFFGGSYGGSLAGAFDSLGKSFGPGTLLMSFSWGLFVSMAGFILIASKGVEI